MARFTSFDVPRIFVSELSQNERIPDSHRPSRVACGSSPGYRNLVQHYTAAGEQPGAGVVAGFVGEFEALCTRPAA